MLQNLEVGLIFWVVGWLLLPVCLLAASPFWWLGQKSLEVVAIGALMLDAAFRGDKN